MCDWVLIGLRLLVGLDLKAFLRLDRVLNKVVETILCTSESNPLALPWGRTPRLDSGVRVRNHVVRSADNRPLVLEKDMYESWKSRMELYMMNRQHGRMILKLVELAIQADCDLKATNIILQGLPPEIYALVSNHKLAKQLWERIQLLMQGTSLTKQE
nr:hypothetical protein [Tanacetum cinerariifolium]